MPCARESHETLELPTASAHVTQNVLSAQSAAGAEDPLTRRASSQGPEGGRAGGGCGDVPRAAAYQRPESRRSSSTATTVAARVSTRKPGNEITASRDSRPATIAETAS